MPRKSIFLATASTLFALGSASATTYYWDGVGTSWPVAGDWSTSSTGAAGTNTGTYPVAGDTADFNGSAITAAQTVTLNGNQAAAVVNFLSTATGGVSISGGGADYTLTLSNGAAINMANGAGAVTIGSTTNGAVNLVLTGTTYPGYGNGGYISNNSSSLLTLVNTISATSGASNLVGFTGSGSGGILFSGTIGTASNAVAVAPTGGGTVTFTGANTYTGSTNVALGTLQLTGANGTLGTTTVTVNPSATFLVNDVGAVNNVTHLIGTGLSLSGGTFRYLGTDQSGSTSTTDNLGAITTTTGSSLINLVNSGGRTPRRFSTRTIWRIA